MPYRKAMKDYYAILEVPPTASQETIKEQYHFLIQAWHPDKFSNPNQKAKAEEKSKEINAAYNVLKNPQKRAQYDIGRNGQSSWVREEQKRQHAEVQRQRRQAEETRRRANNEQQQREQEKEKYWHDYHEKRKKERGEEDRRRTEYERQKRENEKSRVENEQTIRDQPNQPPTGINLNIQNPIKVLIVDDVNVTRENIWKLLRDLNDIVVVGEAADGVEAIEQFDKLMPDIVTMNIHMPRMDGISAIERICKRYPSAKIIVLSADDSLNIKRRASLVGAKEYFVKPPYGDEFIDAIRRVASRKTP